MPLKLIGGIQMNPGEKDYSLIGEMFTRLPKEVKHTGDTTRFIGYEITSGNNRASFFGIEVEQISAIPDGLAAWELTDNLWRLWRSVDGVDSVVWEAETQDAWSAIAPNGRTSIEFNAKCPPEWFGDNSSGEFQITSNSYYKLSKAGFDDDVILEPYNPAWQNEFEKIKLWLTNQLGAEIALRIEHYGSTAIPDIPAKPVIDVLVEVPTFTSARRKALTVMNDECWEYWRYSNHITFIKRQVLMGKRSHHIHMAPENHEIWRGILFRDYLRTHPETAKEYADLKLRLSGEFRSDREAYTEAKTEFVKGVLTEIKS